MALIRALAVAALLTGVGAVSVAAQGTSDPYYEFLVSRRLAGTDDTAGAIAALTRAAAADPASAELRAELASIYLQQNEIAPAREAALAAVALDEQNMDANRVLGLIESSLIDGQGASASEIAGHVRAAITYLERAIAAWEGPPDANLNYTLGRLYFRNGAADKAVNVLSRVVLQNPDSVQGRLALAQAQAAMRDFPAAITTLTEILADEPRVAITLARYQEQAGLSADAAKTYTVALAQQPNSVELKMQRILALYDAKDFRQAAEFSADARTQHPGDSRFARLEASAAFATGDRTRAIDVLERATKAFPKESLLQLSLVSMYNAVGRKADAETALRQVLTIDPANADAKNFLGYLLADRGERLDEAIALVTQAVEADPDNGAYLDSLGWAHFRRGNLVEAEKYLSAAVARMPRNSEILGHLGDLEAKRARWTEAIAAWTRALEGDGEDIDRAAIEKKIVDARAKLRPAR